MTPEEQIQKLTAERDASIGSIHKSSQDIVRLEDKLSKVESERDAANAKCAEMRDLLKDAKPARPEWLNDAAFRDYEQRFNHALSSDGGKGYVKAESLKCFKCDDGHTPLYCLNCAREGYHHDDEWKVVVEALKGFLACCEGHCGACDKRAKEALAHAEKLMSQ